MQKVCVKLQKVQESVQLHREENAEERSAGAKGKGKGERKWRSDMGLIFC